jgi:chitin synthase
MASTPHSQANLVALPAHSQSDTGLTSHIASRYHAQLPVSNLSSQGIVSINTYTSSTRGPNGGKEGSAMGSMEELASRIWTRLGTRQENQAAVYLYVDFVFPHAVPGRRLVRRCISRARSGPITTSQLHVLTIQ